MIIKKQIKNRLTLIYAYVSNMKTTGRINCLGFYCHEKKYRDQM